MRYETQKEQESKKIYTFREVCKEYYEEKYNETERMNQNFEEWVKEYKVYFRYLLNTLHIEEACFKDKRNRWVFNEEGKEFFLRFLENRSGEFYRRIRSSSFIKEDEACIREIIDVACSNLNNNAMLAGEQAKELYPTENSVKLIYWLNILINSDYFDILPGVTYFEHYYRLFDIEELSYALRDIIVKSSDIEKEFEDLEKEYQNKKYKLEEKWIKRIKRCAKLRKKEQDKIDLEADEEHKFYKRFQKKVYNMHEQDVERSNILRDERKNFWGDVSRNTEIKNKVIAFCDNATDEQLEKLDMMINNYDVFWENIIIDESIND